ncbi:MAG TPA: SMI1/KNR4 family protein [Verrucomicrobiae bacterium]
MIKQLTFDKRAPDLATAASISLVETELKYLFPATLREFCTRWNGGFVAKSCELYPVPKEFREFHSEYRKSTGVLVPILFGATAKFEQCSLLAEYRSYNEYEDLDMIIPIASDPFGNRVVLRRGDVSDTVYWWDHELWDIPEGSTGPSTDALPRLMPIAASLEAFYNGLTKDSDDGK